MASVKDVARYFLSKTISNAKNKRITNLKLQKLLYYAQGFYLAMFGNELFPNKLEAWTYGPVCPDAYHEYKKYGSNPAEYDECSGRHTLTDDQKKFLDEVYNVFGQCSAWKLKDMTHSESPWIENYGKANNEIPKKRLKSYFKTRLID